MWRSGKQEKKGKKEKKRWDFKSTRFESKGPKNRYRKQIERARQAFLWEVSREHHYHGEKSEIPPVVGRQWQAELRTGAINRSRPTGFHAVEHEHGTTETDYSHRRPKSAAEANWYAVRAAASS